VDQWPQNWSAIGEFNNLPTIVKEAGYTTALIGKFHLGVPFVPQLAFDHWITFPHGHTVSFYDNEVIDQEERYRFAGHSVDFFTEKTIEFLDHQATQDEPFFAFVPYNGPYGHWPAIKGEAGFELADLYEDADMHSIPREGLSADVLERFGLRVAEGGVREQFKGPLLLPNNVESLKNYFAQVSLIDQGVGRILTALERLKLDQNTLVIYTADHGFSLGHNGIWGHGAAAFPASAHRPSYHIPLIMAGGPAAESVVRNDLVSQIDLFPTLAKAAGNESARPSLSSSARDLNVALPGERSETSGAIFYEQEETRAIRTDQWLYAMRFSGSKSFALTDELYNLKDDPLEKKNLIDEPELADIAAQLRAQITTFFDTYSVPEYDLWNGGRAKSNVTYDRFWKDAWGEDWKPEFSGGRSGPYNT
ncbi:MAG: sulfatase-like hydrolase/transferase, partial [Pseudomonadota bacterium]